jgi:hypothetical protein
MKVSWHPHSAANMNAGNTERRTLSVNVAFGRVMGRSFHLGQQEYKTNKEWRKKHHCRPISLSERHANFDHLAASSA